MFSGLPATNLCRSSYPHKKLLYSPPCRTRCNRCRTPGHTSMASAPPPAPGGRTILKNSPARSARTSRVRTFDDRPRRAGRPATTNRAPSRAPSRANFALKRLVSMMGWTWVEVAWFSLAALTRLMKGVSNESCRSHREYCCPGLRAGLRSLLRCGVTPPVDYLQPVLPRLAV